MTRTEVRSESDLLPPGAAPGTVPTDLEQATGLERLEILGKMEGIDVFDMRPLDASRKGVLHLHKPLVLRPAHIRRHVARPNCGSFLRG